ncbi:unnamed protein product [Rotaria sordida]|uniref:Uncharacterized protein n=1 Tax=Rotaria sordida TaxID=392033 RepID=A0A815JPB2_9BILA|nr:unnamed protein product [Rotaria sordida]CAF1382670.1 unnamed protein product [Rotaria sordida]
MDENIFTATPEQLTLMIKLQQETQATQRKILAAQKETQAAQKETQAAEKEKQKTADANRILEETTLKRLKVEQEMKAEENKRIKQMKTEDNRYSSRIDRKLYLALSNSGFYSDCVQSSIKLFNITSLVDDNNNVNDDMINIFQNYFNILKSNKKFSECEIQELFNQSITELFRRYNSLTSLKYVNSSKQKTVGDKAPDCCFTFKNININKKSEYEA